MPAEILTPQRNGGKRSTEQVLILIAFKMRLKVLKMLVEIPLTRPADTLFPSDGEREEVREVRFDLKTVWN